MLHFVVKVGEIFVYLSFYSANWRTYEGQHMFTMKKLILFVLLFASILVSSAQQRTLRVSYASVSKISAAIEVSGYSDEVKKQLEEELKKHTEQRETSTLLQNGTRSNYTIVEDKFDELPLANSNSPLMKRTSFEIGNVQSIYLDLEANVRLTKKAFTDNPLVVKEKLTASPQWKIGTETKEILGKKCTKATLTVAVKPATYNDTRITHKDTTETYTAWFCKEIAVPFGPEGLYGLPGLILETEINSKITTATKVEYISQGQLLLPPKGKRVTPEQYDKLLEESLTSFLETNENTEWEIRH